MAGFTFIPKRKCRSILSMIWMACVIASIVLIVITFVCYNGVDEVAGVAVIQNRQILEEKQGLRSREEELLGLAAQLEKELLEHQERIKKRLEILRARRGDGVVRSSRGEMEERRGRDGMVPEHSLKRRLMDARPSRDLGREVPGLYGGGGGMSGNHSSDRTNRDDKSILGVKVKLTTYAPGIVESIKVETRSLPTVTADIKATILNLPSQNTYANLLSSLPTNEKDSNLQNDKHNKIKSETLQSLPSFQNFDDNRTKGKVSTWLRSPVNDTGNGRLKSRSHSDLKVFKGGSVSHSDNRTSHFQRSGHIEDQYAAIEEVVKGVVEATIEPDQAPPAALLGCEDLARVNSREHSGSGYTKLVERVELTDGRWVAAKSVWTEGKDVTACTQLGMAKRDCIRLANYKLMKEIALLQQLRHPNIVKLLGFCVHTDDPTDAANEDSPSTVAIVEHGSPLYFLNVLQTPWEDRLRICLGISRLLVYLADSPIGSLAIHDFKMSQFVLVDGKIKLSDLDDVDDGLPSCSFDSDCGLEIRPNNTVFASCVKGVCANYSMMSNVAHAFTNFFTLLQFDAPLGMNELVGQLTNNTKRAAWLPNQVSQHMQKILNYYQTGQYMRTSDNLDMSEIEYRVYHDRDIVGAKDYWCSGTRILAPACVLSVHDVNEAIRICALERQCDAFVLTSERTWTGRYIAYFKEGTYGKPEPSRGKTLYVFPR